MDIKDAHAVICPTCHAPAGQPCNAPTDTGRRIVTWVHMAREDAWRTIGRQPVDYFLTFGIQYNSQPHPMWPECNPKGWVRITASTYGEARAIAVDRFGLDWSMLTPSVHFNPTYFPAGELMVLP